MTTIETTGDEVLREVKITPEEAALLPTGNEVLDGFVAALKETEMPIDILYAIVARAGHHTRAFVLARITEEEQKVLHGLGDRLANSVPGGIADNSEDQ